MSERNGSASRARGHVAFDTAHPAVAALYLVITLGLTMFCVQPVLIGMSFVASFLASAQLFGARPTFASLRWQLPLIALIAVANPLFSASGSTEVLRFGARAVYLESLCYGACMGGLLVASALWFRVAARLLPFDHVMALLGNAAPTVALMISMCMRLIPRFVRQGRSIVSAQEVPFRGEAAARAEVLRGRLRASSVLMGWALEDSLETADAMRARGWETGCRRTTYTRFRFTAADGAACATLVLGAALVCLLSAAATAQFSFYPQLSRLVAWWGYAPIAAWMLLPTFLTAGERRRFA